MIGQDIPKNILEQWAGSLSLNGSSFYRSPLLSFPPCSTIQGDTPFTLQVVQDAGWCNTEYNFIENAI